MTSGGYGQQLATLYLQCDISANAQEIRAVHSPWCIVWCAVDCTYVCVFENSPISIWRLKKHLLESFCLQIRYDVIGIHRASIVYIRAKKTSVSDRKRDSEVTVGFGMHERSTRIL
jgi:hypothetical protein